MKEKTVTVATRITPLMVQEIERFLPEEYTGMADYLRDLIREDLEKRKEQSLKEVSVFLNHPLKGEE